MERGEGCEQNYAAAADWFRQAASQGHVAAKVHLGSLLDTGRGVNRVDREQANALFREAAEAGNVIALYRIGMIYFRGCGAEQNTAMAPSYWQRAADQAFAPAERQIGYAYWKGQGDYEKSLKLAKRYTE